MIKQSERAAKIVNHSFPRSDHPSAWKPGGKLGDH